MHSMHRGHLLGVQGASTHLAGGQEVSTGEQHPPPTTSAMPWRCGFVLPPQLLAQPCLLAWRQPACQECGRSADQEGLAASSLAAGGGTGGCCCDHPLSYPFHSVAFLGQRKSPLQLLLSECRDPGRIRQALRVSLVNNE